MHELIPNSLKHLLPATRPQVVVRYRNVVVENPVVQPINKTAVLILQKLSSGFADDLINRLMFYFRYRFNYDDALCSYSAHLLQRLARRRRMMQHRQEKYSVDRWRDQRHRAFVMKDKRSLTQLRTVIQHIEQMDLSYGQDI